MKKAKLPRRNSVRRDVKPEEWLQINWKGVTHLVAVSSLLTAYEEKSNGRK